MTVHPPTLAPPKLVTDGKVNIQGLNLLTQNQISAAQGAIGKRFDLRRTALTGEKQGIGNTFKRLLGQLQRQQELGTRNVNNDSARRGLFQSGIRTQNQAKVDSSFAEGSASAEGSRTDALSQIETALALLLSDQETEEVGVAQAFENAALALQAQLSQSGLLQGGDQDLTAEQIEAMLRALAGI